MEFIKKIGKIILFILSIFFCIILIFSFTIFNIKNVALKFISEKQIKETISSIDINDLFKDENGEEIKEIKEIKNELVNVGLPIKVVEEYLDSKQVKEVTSNITTSAINYVFYDEKPQYIENINKDSILEFFDTNTKIIINEIKNNNVPGSEYLTDENIDNIENKLEDVTPIIEEKISQITGKITEKIDELKNSKQNKDLQEMLKFIRFISSEKFNNYLIIIIIISSLGIIICRLSFYKYLKWIGTNLIISGSILLGISYAIKYVYPYVNKFPFILQNLFKNVLENSKTSLLQLSLPYFIVGIILIILNIIIRIILEIRENKKFELN